MNENIVVIIVHVFVFERQHVAVRVVGHPLVQSLGRAADELRQVRTSQRLCFIIMQQPKCNCSCCRMINIMC